MPNVCNGAGGLEKGGGREVEIGRVGVGGLESEELRSGGVEVGGLGSRIVTPTLPTPTVFHAADPYSTSHVSRQILFASIRPRVKFVCVKLSCTPISVT